MFVTVKTKGVLGLFVSDDWCAAAGSGPLAFCVRDVRINHVGLSEVAKIDARKSEPIDINATITAMRSAKACGEVFFFIVLWG